MTVNNALDSANLKTRYLLWLYKTTKEELDKIDRKFIQLEIDDFIFKGCESGLKNSPSQQKDGFQRHLKEFSDYIKKKRSDAFDLKFDKNGNIKPAYKYLSSKLSTIEKAIKQFLGQRSLREIKSLYQQEMTCRILQEGQHK